MLTLIVGGAASGKSEYAERLIVQTGMLPRYYIATMEPFDDECRARIAKHQASRVHRQFKTIECYTGLDGVRLPQRGAVLLECMSNLVANELYSPDGAGCDTVAAVLRGVDALLPQCQNLVIVSNEVFTGGSDYAGDTLRYLKILAAVNRGLAARADNVAELVCGQAIYYKGKEPGP